MIYEFCCVGPSLFITHGRKFIVKFCIYRHKVASEYVLGDPVTGFSSVNWPCVFLIFTFWTWSCAGFVVNTIRSLPWFICTTLEASILKVLIFSSRPSSPPSFVAFRLASWVVPSDPTINTWVCICCYCDWANTLVAVVVGNVIPTIVTSNSNDKYTCCIFLANSRLYDILTLVSSSSSINFANKFTACDILQKLSYRLCV